MITKKLFIFDLDGTLADVYSAIEKSLNFTLKKLGYSKVDFEEVKRNVGRGDKLFIKGFFSRKDANKALSIYRAHHLKSIARYSKLLPYAKTTLSKLKRKEKCVALASNRPQIFTDKIIKKLKIDKYLDEVLCADTINSLKPQPKIINMLIKDFDVKKSDAVYIGDMTIDMETARRAGVEAVYIRGGSSTFSEVKKYKNKKVISSLKEIFDLYG
ncbi:MAG: HAD family hydrolase [Candidatus Omnitrophota bacterium]|nr:MAG: HAD family hydrolase [Candidatus Omnitrophota bacterium]